MSKTLIAILISVLVVIGLIIGLVYIFNPEATAPEGYATYRDHDGFSFTYPEEWRRVKDTVLARDTISFYESDQLMLTLKTPWANSRIETHTLEEATLIATNDDQTDLRYAYYEAMLDDDQDLVEISWQRGCEPSAESCVNSRENGGNFYKYLSDDEDVRAAQLQMIDDLIASFHISK